MSKLRDWFLTFTQNKTEIAALSHSDHWAVHSIRRFLQGCDKLWEVAITDTDRLVVRSGTIESDGMTVVWSTWETMHDVDLSTHKSERSDD